MLRLNVYVADITIGPQIRGWIYSYYPMPDDEHRIAHPNGSMLNVEISGCHRHILHAPDRARLITDPTTGDLVVQLDQPEGSLSLGPEAVLEASRLGKGFDHERIYWNYCKHRDAIERFDADVRAAAEASGNAPTGELLPPADHPV